ncbi:MAG: peptidylprolyl isomerase, partial [Planctomycetota bacterium]|nr:peptidylprolyl isomerase [Planctomycetota bacterium]
MLEGGEHPAAANYAEDGLTLAMALLAYKAGNFEWAERDLTTLAARYPFDAFLDAHRRLAIRGKRASGEEALRTKADEAKKLPRATIETTAGDIVLELFHDDARNTVFNFVWLAKHGFYDDCAIHRTVPAFLVQTGDPFSRKVSARPELVGSGTPGYAIRTELGKRWPLRGYVALANGGANTDGSQFMIFTGTAVHLHGEVTVFARVLEGLGIVERLQAGAKADRIVKVTVTGLDPERTYQPSTVAGNRAPAPRVPPVRGDPK